MRAVHVYFMDKLLILHATSNCIFPKNLLIIFMTSESSCQEIMDTAYQAGSMVLTPHPLGVDIGGAEPS